MTNWADPNSNGADDSTVCGRTSQLEFDAAANRGISLPEAIHDTSGKGNKQPVRRIQTSTAAVDPRHLKVDAAD